jgi:hypothetical protein
VPDAHQQLELHRHDEPQQVACDAQASTNAVADANSTSGLAFDTRSGQYTYTWKTEKGWANTCRQFTLRLTDTTEHTALFRFTK